MVFPDPIGKKNHPPVGRYIHGNNLNLPMSNYGNAADLLNVTLQTRPSANDISYAPPRQIPDASEFSDPHCLLISYLGDGPASPRNNLVCRSDTCADGPKVLATYNVYASPRAAFVQLVREPRKICRVENRMKQYSLTGTAL